MVKKRRIKMRKHKRRKALSHPPRPLKRPRASTPQQRRSDPVELQLELQMRIQDAMEAELKSASTSTRGWTDSLRRLIVIVGGTFVASTVGNLSETSLPMAIAVAIGFGMLGAVYGFYEGLSGLGILNPSGRRTQRELLNEDLDLYFSQLVREAQPPQQQVFQ